MIPSWARTAALHAMFANPPDVPGVIHAVAFASDGDFWDVSPSQAAVYVTTVDGFAPTVVLPATLLASYQRQCAAQPPAAPGP